MDRLRVDDLRALDRGQPLAIVRLATDAGVVAAVDAGDDFGGPRHRVARHRPAGGDRRDRRPDQRRPPALHPLAERVDRAELTAGPPLDPVPRTTTPTPRAP